MVPNGYEAPFIRVYFNKQELSQNCIKLRYVYDEENDDEIELYFDVDDQNELDKPYFQEKAKLELLWGFIGGEVSNTRVIYIQDVKVQGTRENIKVILSCAEKGVSLKGASSKEVHKNKTLPQVVNSYAKKHNLTGYLELDDANQNIQTKLEPIPGETLSEYLKRENIAKQKKASDEFNKKPEAEKRKILLDNITKTIKDPDPIKQRERELREKYQKDWEEGAPINVELAVQRDLAFFKVLQNFKVHKNLPQANKSDKQFLDDIARREPNGPYIVETRDNDVILKRRNFSKKPFVTYEYGGATGELLEFSPESKKRVRKGSSVAMGFSGWNKLNKTFFKGTTNAADGDPSLAKAMEMLEYYKGIQEKVPGGGRLIVGERIGKTFLPFIHDQNVASKIDNTGIYTPRLQTVPITIDDQVTALKKAVDDHQEKVENRKKEMYNALGINPISAYEQASNLRRDSELNSNPATALVWGKPALESGLIITILGFGKKYSGNYYIKKATHEIDKSGYFVDLEMNRQGHNIKTNEDYADHKDLGRPLNNQIGDTEPAIGKKNLKVKTNP